MKLAKDTALIVVDVQNDFCPGGSLAVTDGNSVVPVINSIAPMFHTVIATQDWHPVNHSSFASNNEGTVVYQVKEINGTFQVMWPDHCVQGTHGAAFHSELATDCFSAIIRKGTQPEVDSYSAFTENDRKTVTGLRGYLQDRGVRKVYVAGLATDYCAAYTAMDAKAAGFEVYLVADACRGVDVPQGSVDTAISEMREMDIHIITSEDLLK